MPVALTYFPTICRTLCGGASCISASAPGPRCVFTHSRPFPFDAPHSLLCHITFLILLTRFHLPLELTHLLVSNVTRPAFFSPSLSLLTSFLFHPLFFFFFRHASDLSILYLMYKTKGLQCIYVFPVALRMSEPESSVFFSFPSSSCEHSCVPRPLLLHF